jgi:protein SFI1
MTVPGWLHRSRQERQRKLAERTTRDGVTKVWSNYTPWIEKLIERFKRILKQTLCLWTNRVIEVKLREYEVAERYDLTMKA